MGSAAEGAPACLCPRPQELVAGLSLPCSQADPGVTPVCFLLQRGSGWKRASAAVAPPPQDVSHLDQER